MTYKSGGKSTQVCVVVDFAKRMDLNFAKRSSMVVNFAKSIDLAIVNTCFKKKEER